MNLMIAFDAFLLNLPLPIWFPYCDTSDWTLQYEKNNDIFKVTYGKLREDEVISILNRIIMLKDHFNKK